MKRQYKIPLATSGQNVNVKTLTTSELLQLRRKLAKRINQRMVRLEAKGLTQGGAYADYQNILNRFFGGVKRIPENLNIYKHLPRTEVSAMQKLLKEKTSTVQGWNEVMTARVQTMYERYGIRFKSNQELADFIRSIEFKELSALYSSKQALRIINKSGYDISELKNILDEFRGLQDRSKANEIAKALGFKSEAEALKYKGK